MTEENRTNQSAKPEVNPGSSNDEEKKRDAVEKSPQKTDDTRKSGYDENGKLDNPKIEEESSE